MCMVWLVKFLFSVLVRCVLEYRLFGLQCCEVLLLCDMCSLIFGCVNVSECSYFLIWLSLVCLVCRNLCCVGMLQKSLCIFIVVFGVCVCGVILLILLFLICSVELCLLCVWCEYRVKWLIDVIDGSVFFWKLRVVIDLRLLRLVILLVVWCDIVRGNCFGVMLLLLLWMWIRCMLFFLRLILMWLVLVLIVFLISFLIIDVGCLIILLVVIWLIRIFGNGWIGCGWVVDVMWG